MSATDWTASLNGSTTVTRMQNACLDFSRQAFDRLQHSIVLNKMRMYGFSDCVTKLLGDFLSNREQQCVKYNGCFSSYGPVTVGAPQPQDTKLGPVLWLIYSNNIDIEDYLKSSMQTLSFEARYCSR